MWIPDFPNKKIPPRPVGIPWESKPPNVAPQKKLVPPMPLRTNSRSRHTGCPLPMLPATAFDVDRQLVHLKSWSVIQIWCESIYGEPLMGGMLQFQHWKNRLKTALTGWIWLIGISEPTSSCHDLNSENFGKPLWGGWIFIVFLTSNQPEDWGKRRLPTPGSFRCCLGKLLPSRELTYPIQSQLGRWVSFPFGGIC